MARPLRVLMLTTLLPGARRTGSEVATQAFADAIRAAGHQLTLLGYRRAGSTPPFGPGDVAVADRAIETASAGLRPAAWMARAVLTRQPYSAAKFAGRAYRRAVRAEPEPDVIVCDHAQMAWAVPDGAAPLVVLAHNVEHRLHAELPGAVHRREAKRLLASERSLLARARAVWALTDADAVDLDALGGPPARVFALPGAAAPPAPTAPPTRDVVVLGSWTWHANAEGLRWFVAEVAPQLDGMGVEIGGAGGEAIAGELAVGVVDDALAFLQSARVVAVPSTAGSGVQIKTLDAIASGRAVVATSVAMRGIDDAPAGVHVTDTAAGFAAALRTAEPPPDGAGARWAAERARRFQADVAAALEAVAG